MIVGLQSWWIESQGEGVGPGGSNVSGPVQTVSWIKKGLKWCGFRDKHLHTVDLGN